MPFSATKLRVLELGAPRIVDPENAFAVYDAFAFSADKEQARQILRRNGLLIAALARRPAGLRSVFWNDRLPRAGAVFG